MHFYDENILVFEYFLIICEDFFWLIKVLEQRGYVE